MKQWEHIKIADATLSEWAHAEMSTQTYGRERIFVAEFFGEQRYIVVSERVGPYHHNTAQFVQNDFFESKGFKKTLECSPDADYEASATAAGFEDIDIDFNKTFAGYSNAAVGYENAEKEKVLVIIERQDVSEMETQYRVFSGQKHANLKKDWFEYAKNNNCYKGKKINAACKFLDLKEVGWKDVILPKPIIKLLQSVVGAAIQKRHIYIKNGLSLKRGLMLAGGPGNGKTSSLKAMAKDCPDSVTVIYAQPSHLMQAKDVRNVCQMAKDLNPSLLIIEDMDWIAEDRNTGDAGRVIELMNQLDGLEEFTDVITIATTNDVEKIEKAIKNRPGRFDRVVTIENPDDDCRRRMITLFSSKWKLDGIDIEQLVKFTKGLSGAHMADLCKTAAAFAIDSGSLDEGEIIVLKAEHFDQAIKEVKDKDFSTYLQSKAGGGRKRIGFSPLDDDEF